MLNSFEKNIISLIKSSLDGTPPSISDTLDLEVLYKFSQKMQITPLLYYGVEKTPNAFDTIYGKRFLKSEIVYSYLCQKQSEQINVLKREFDKEKIDYMLLKGSIIREYYPNVDMRLMSDADILIRKEQFKKKIKPLMKKLGYVDVLESDHEYVFTKDGFQIELHKRLIPSYNKDYYAYFGDGWRLARKKDGDNSEYEMTSEDNFVYMFTHYAKHYRDAGIGIKHITDFYVFLKKYKDLDWIYINQELESLQLLEFWKNTQKMLGVWFNDAECDEISEFMTHRIFSGDAYGTHEAHVLSQGVKTSKTTKNVRAKTFFKSVFPAYKEMKISHRYLSKAPFLLPLAWTFRWVAIIFNPKRIKRNRHNMKTLTNENIHTYQSELNYVGLDFNFE
ncbi:MAG: nucleotidyltransferase family protein [Clostridia bacterium]|nr:nucleotidyltransferase family protein [Clostridia bacterium]